MILGYSNEKHVISPLVGADLVPYFKIVLKATGSSVFTEKDLGTTVTSFSVSEKIGEVMTISLSIIDPLGLNALYFSQKNKEVLIDWGIKRINTSFVVPAGDDEITGKYSRGTLNCVVADIGDVELKDGISTFTTTLRIGSKNASEPRMRTFSSGSLGDMFKKLCSEIGAKSFIKFSIQDKVLTDDRSFIQNNQSNVEFLREMCIKYNLKLVMTDGGTTTKVITHISITDMGYVNSADEDSNAKSGNTGKYHYLDYGNANSNIIGGKLQTNNNGGTGSTAAIVDGKLTLTSSKDEVVSVYELDAVKTKAIVRAAYNRGLKDSMALIEEINSKTTDDLHGAGGIYETYFKSASVKTYPEGQGYTASFDVVANPLFNLNDQVWLGLRTKQVKSENTFVNRNFKTPDVTSGITEKFRTNPDNVKKTIWHFTAIEQSISTDGYRMNVELSR